MTTAPCTAPLALEDLIAYARGELDAATEPRIEEHYFSCEHCTRRLDWLRRLGAEIADSVRRGSLSASVTGELVRRARDEGLVLRSYELAPSETVACTAGPEDDFVVVRLKVGSCATSPVDLVAEVTNVETGETETRVTKDVVVDPKTAEIIYLYAGNLVREFPRTRWVIHARVRDPGGERLLGPYTMEHTPWHELRSPQV